MRTASIRFRFLSRNRGGLAALAAYVLLAFLYLGVRLLFEGGSQYIGEGSDPEIFIWAFAWWPHAISHGENPFFSHAVWAPDGFNLAWSTTVPGLALLFAPLTVIAGPVFAYNVAVVLMPAFAAWTAFLLCRHLTHSFWPALVGGYLFGFSSYELAHAGGGQLNLISVGLLPIFVLVVLRFLDDDLSGRGLVVRLGPLFAFELLLSTEITATVALSLALALLACHLLVPARRRQIVALLPYLVASAALAGLLTAPFVYYLVTGFRGNGYFRPGAYTADLLNFVLPAKRTLVGGGSAPSISRQFPLFVPQPEAYVGLPALLIVGLFFRSRVRAASHRFFLATLVVSLVAAMGAHATVAGHRIVALPWLAVQSLPVFDNILTVRLALYVSLIVAVLVAFWTAARQPGVLRWLLPTLAVLAILPNLSGAWASSAQIPSFFTDSVYRTCLDPGERILPLPIGQGSAMLWQAESQFRFNIAGGHVGPFIPPSFLTPASIYYVTGGNHLGPEQAGLVKSFIATKQVSTVVVAQYEIGFFAGALNRLATPHNVGGVVLYHFAAAPPSCPSA